MVDVSSTTVGWIPFHMPTRTGWTRILFLDEFSHVTLPMNIRLDSMGVVYMASSLVTNKMSKHTDPRNHLVRNFANKGMIKLEYIETELNIADDDQATSEGEAYLFHHHADTIPWKSCLKFSREVWHSMCTTRSVKRTWISRFSYFVYHHVHAQPKLVLIGLFMSKEERATVPTKSLLVLTCPPVTQIFLRFMQGVIT